MNLNISTTNKLRDQRLSHYPVWVGNTMCPNPLVSCPKIELDFLVDLRVRGKSRAHFRSRIGGTTPPQFLYVDFVVRGWGDILIPRYSKIFQDICKEMKYELD